MQKKETYHLSADTDFTISEDDGLNGRKVRCPYNNFPERLSGVIRIGGTSWERFLEFEGAMEDRCPRYSSDKYAREEAFRRGYHYAVAAVIDYLWEAEVSKEIWQPLLDWCNDGLYPWHYARHSGQRQEVPERPIGKPVLTDSFDGVTDDR